MMIDRLNSMEVFMKCRVVAVVTIMLHERLSRDPVSILLSSQVLFTQVVIPVILFFIFILFR